MRTISVIEWVCVVSLMGLLFDLIYVRDMYPVDAAAIVSAVGLGVGATLQVTRFFVRRFS